ncbi:hypothetical protein MW290_05785 [Aquincola tertiaricarbonis]|uniref:Uncharacterized protein n=1 Tax=Aquincola tertiaricarbonis TaxID=391953 RepID=A0ABY4S9Z6_AQUTE|nr:hypothetical protein [Aquincola tertiaricarbonis]URI08090.1 hypothetical protein MW290_05785 [Aquincola tertiaricarbonis]
MDEHDEIEILNPLERRCILLAGVSTGLVVLAAVLALFEGDGRTPWFPPGGWAASAAASCEAPQAGPARHECLRQIAQSARASAPLAVAAAR